MPDIQNLDLPAVQPLSVAEFPRSFRFRMVRAYPTISEIADVHEATHDEIDEGFARCLNNRHLRVVAESYLEDRRA